MRLMIAGGGGFRVPLVYRALCSGRYAGLVSEVVLFDVDGGRLAAIEAVLRSMSWEFSRSSEVGGAPDGSPDVGGSSCRPPTVTSTTSLPHALNGTDIVFAAIRPGGTAGRVADERVAQDLGLLGQETTGAGGISYALRSIPAMLELAANMRTHCPDAWLINFTNPAGMVTQALAPVLGRKVIGICDSASALVHRAARAAGVLLPAGKLDGVGYYGLNHLGWLYRLESGGRDFLPGLLADREALASFEEGRLFPQSFLRGLGLLPNEYLFYYYEAARATAGMRAMARTRGESIHGQQAELYPRLATAGDEAYGLWEAARQSREEGYLAEARTGGEARNPEDLAGGGYEQVALAVMRALAGDAAVDGMGDVGGGARGAATELILNTPNSPGQSFTGRSPAPGQSFPGAGGPRAAIPGLPPDAVVEVPCTVTPDGAVPIQQDRPAEPQLSLLRQVKKVELLTVRAASGGDRDAALEAFAEHPLVGSAQLANALLTGYEGAFPDLAGLWRR
ncbi:family 4 glycosyl hydrolase [Arthrobacter globiformis]|uniref:family 4 glycosyl hydrolase n=1 Tax=Arthrobacter globiformis TaxID=1665 RepID=UPI00278B1298|nr:6-phospho-beta-glucosidase [Arthrobacter globiformis]MDQ0866190.1 6-phospho-beta-glucosidase [Arthrobacter globiformis]